MIEVAEVVVRLDAEVLGRGETAVVVLGWLVLFVSKGSQLLPHCL